MVDARNDADSEIYKAKKYCDELGNLIEQLEKIAIERAIQDLDDAMRGYDAVVIKSLMKIHFELISYTR